MSYNPDSPANAVAEEIRENFRALKEDRIVAAATTTKLETARNINGVSFDGTADIVITQVNGKDIATIDEIPTSLPANGGDADTVDGKHAIDFAPAGYVPPNATEATDGSMSAADKAKLDGIEVGAQVNQNAFSNVLVNGATIHADSQTDTLELVAGANIALAADVANENITIAVTGKVASAAQADSASTANTATKLETARNINGVSFDGSANIEITTANGGTIATTNQIAAVAAARGKKLFTASGTFIVPTGVTQVWVSLCGGGGNGGRGDDAGCNGGGGGGGDAKLVINVPGLISGNAIAVTVGGASGTSSFGPYVSCAGGGAGTDGSASYDTYAPAGAAGGPGATAGFEDAPGGNIFSGYTSNGYSGYGGGGSGGPGNNYRGIYNGVLGKPGMVLVEW